MATILILCVEDEADIRGDITEELRDTGYETVEAANGREGLQAIAEHKPDLVLCDITMPEMNGYELLTALREKHPEFEDLPFVFLSALADRKDIIAGRQLGADDYVTKPVDFEMLLATVESRLRQVARMQARKQRHLIKLYRVLTGQEPPAGDGGPASAESTESSSQPSEPLTIVTVTNDEVDLGDLPATLEARGYSVIVMHSGRRFLDTVGDLLSPDLVLMSYNSIDLQAPLVVKTLKAKQEVDFPIILLVPSSMDLPSIAEQLPHFDDYITVPFDRETLMEKIAALSIKAPEPEDLLASA
ncbi:MAG: response regulator [Rhodospirillales bacterium]